MIKMTLKPLILGGIFPFKNKITPQIHVIQAPAKALNEDRLAKKAKVIQMSRPEVPVAAQRQRL